MSPALFRFVKVSLLVALSWALAGCQVMEVALPPRMYQVNLGSQNVREDLILLNIVRASRLEPLNFTALSKYTATGSLNASGGATNNIGIDYSLFKGGSTLGALVGSSPKTALSGQAGGQLGNSFDMVPLDTQEFYGNFLAPLSPEQINVLINAGLTKEMVLNAVLRAITVNFSHPIQNFKSIRLINDPGENMWTDETGASHPDPARCEQEDMRDYDIVSHSRPRWAPFYTDYWRGRHFSDCSYQKFRRLLQEALRYGVTTTAIKKKPSKTEVMRVNTINVTVSTQQEKQTQQRVVILCFDPAEAARRGQPLHTSKPRCDQEEIDENQIKGPLETGLGEFDKSVTPEIRSSYGVFQYFGRVLNTPEPVLLTDEFTVRRTNDRVLLKITNASTGCFAQVDYAGRSYCVPAEEAANTKEVLTLLIALVNLSTSRNSLPATPSVLVNP